MSRFSVESCTFHGLKALTLRDAESGWDSILAVEWGSNLVSLDSTRDTRDQLRILRTPNSLDDLKEKSVGWGFPILMPPNRIDQGKFTFNGRDYVFDINEAGTYHIHGLVHNLPWRVISTSTDGAAMVTTAIRSDDHPSIKKSYPHSFELRMTFSLKESRMDFIVEAENFGSEPMPFGIGFHPYFNVPLSPTSSKANCTVQVPARQVWELANFVPTGKRLPVTSGQDLREPVQLSTVMLDDVYTDLELANGVSLVELTDNGADITVKYGAGSEFKHWVIWTGRSPEDPFVCLEPYTWVTNAPNLDLPHDETGLIVLGGGETFTGRMWVEILK